MASLFSPQLKRLLAYVRPYSLRLTAGILLLAFVALVQNQISSEHREWIPLRKVAPDLALDRLKSLRLSPLS